MKLYSIANWSTLYENNRSRAICDLEWVKVPNRHDGENYTSVVTHKDGAVIFAAFILMLQVASRCAPRGVLVKPSGQPHTPKSLALKTRAPEKWFEIAIEYLEKNTDWIVAQTLPDTNQWDGITPPPPQADGEVKPVEAEPAPAPTPKVEVSDEKWLEQLQLDEPYKRLSVREEYAKMVNWCRVNKKQPTRRRFINWLNHCERPMVAPPTQTNYEKF